MTVPAVVPGKPEATAAERRDDLSGGYAAEENPPCFVNRDRGSSFGRVG
ncbi:MAG: hypothetical protein IPN65_03555 [Elusimicrobia bacterium]|nr:hypothetical protein [Elusimicrobiota bacterium]